MLVGFAWLLSCGKVQKATLQSYGVAMAEMPEFSGVFRSFYYEEQEWYYIFYYLFCIFWTMELFTALGQYVVSYAVQSWYFTPYERGEKDDVPCCPILCG